MERVRANLIYFVTLLIVGYFIYVYFYDKLIPTGQYFDAVITRVEPVHTGFFSRSGNAKVRKVDVYLSIGNGAKIVKRVRAKSWLAIGEEIKLREFKSKHRGVLKYQIAY